MSRKRKIPTIAGEAPQIAQEGTNQKDEGGTTPPDLAALGARLVALGREKGMTAQERLGVLDAFVLAALGVVSNMVAAQQATISGLGRVVAQMLGNEDMGAQFPQVDVEADTNVLHGRFVEYRLQAEIDYLEAKPAKSGGLIIP
jgi:hypothetical protein